MKNLKTTCLLIFALLVPVFAFSQIHEAKALPGIYRTQANHQGKVVKLDYQAHRYDSDTLIIKHCYVYLPWGYDDHPEQKYDILYFMHGGGSTAEKFLGGLDSISINRNNLDHMIEEGRIPATIVVTPSFYRNDYREDPLPEAGKCVEIFPRELVEELIPAVEGKFRTFAKSTSKADIMESRDHRAFAGFSMGGVTTWWVFAKAKDYIKYFVPLSGDCWCVQQMGGKNAPEETAKKLAEYAAKGNQDFVVYSLTGSEDSAVNQLTPQIEAMKKQSIFRFGNDFTKDNLFFSVFPGGLHDSAIYAAYYLYNALPAFFK